ncbi:MAG: VanZ family protein [Kineosporiaceae bacterium]
MTWVFDSYLLWVPRPLIAVVIAAAALGAYLRGVWLRRRGRPHPWLTVAFECGLVLSVLTVLAVTLHPREGGGRPRQFAPYPTGRRDHVTDPDLREAESLANLVMLVPVGLFLGLLRPHLVRGRRALAVVAVIPIVPEILQYALPLGRVAAVEDVELGICGTAAGLALGSVLAATARRRPRRLATWTCASCTSGSETTCLHGSSPTRRG